MNIKVCHISYNHDPFDDRIYWKELLALKEAGYEAVHLCVGDEDSSFLSCEGIQIVKVKRKQVSRNIWFSRFLHVFFKRRGTIDDLINKAEEINADIYHLHDLQVLAMANRVKKLTRNPKVIYDTHEPYHLLLNEGYKGKLFGFIGRFFVFLISRWEIRIARSCDYIITTDQYTCDYFKSKVPSVLVQLVYNYSFFLPTENVNGPKRYDLIYTGLISKARGVGEVISAVHLLKKQIPDITFLVIGAFESEDYKQELYSQISKLNVEANIIIHDPVPFSEIEDFYKQSKVGVGLFHKTPKYDTFIPIKLFEYMSFGLPVVFSDHGPSSHIIQQEQCGILVNYRNLKETSNAILKLLSEKKLYDLYSKKGQQAILERFNWNLEKRKLIEIYRKYS